jgi:hypothetical protein
MNLVEIVRYIAPSLTISVVFSTLILYFIQLFLGNRSKIINKYFLITFMCSFFALLTQFPLPIPDTLDCSGGGAKPILKPFATLDHIVRLWNYSRNDPSSDLSWWYGSKIIQAATMNFTLCAAIGAALAGHINCRWPYAKALTFGVLLSGSVELAQLTGLFGLYSCAWRQFEVDDLILNITGLMTGFAIMRYSRQQA